MFMSPIGSFDMVALMLAVRRFSFRPLGETIRRILPTMPPIRLRDRVRLAPAPVGEPGLVKVGSVSGSRIVSLLFRGDGLPSRVSLAGLL